MSAEEAYAAHLARTQEHEAGATLEGLDVWFDAAAPRGPGRALDWGAGRGQALHWLRGRGLRPEAFEPDPVLAGSLRAAGETVHEATDGGAAFLAAHEGAFDLVLAKDVLEHVARERIVETTRALGRALRPGGTLVVSVPHAVSFAGVYVRYGDFTHTTAFTEESLRYVLEAAGLSRIANHGPRFGATLRPTRLAYRALRGAWHLALRGIYLLEHPSRRGQPPHFFPRLVASAIRP